MTAVQTKKYLSEYRLHMARAIRLKREMETFKASKASIQKEIEECINKSGIIEGIIASHGNLCEREIMLRKYVYGQTIEKIAEELNYSPRHIQRILTGAVGELGAKLN